MPLYEELVRRTLAARETAQAVQDDSRRVRDLAQLLRDAHAGETMLLHCAWCDKLQIGDEWLHLEAVGQGSVQIAQSLIRKSSHGICPDCFTSVREAAAAERARKGIVGTAEAGTSGPAAGRRSQKRSRRHEP